MKLFRNGLKGPYLIIVKAQDVGAYSIYGARTQREAISIAFEQLRRGSEVVGIATLLDVTVSMDDPHGADEETMYLVAEENGRVQDYVAWDDNRQGDILDLILKWASKPNTMIHVASGADLHSKR